MHHWSILVEHHEKQEHNQKAKITKVYSMKR